MIVVDTDVIAAFWIRSPRTSAALQLRREDSEWIVPRLWRSELRSVLRQHLIHGSLSLGDTIWIAQKAVSMLNKREYAVRNADVMHLVARTKHSSYDCEYVSLAEAMNCTLITGDSGLARAFPETAVLLEDRVR